MANNLTGDFEAVLQVSLRQINGVLATMHQVRADPDATPSFPHIASIRIGRTPRIFDTEVEHFNQWVINATQQMRASGAGSADVQTVMSGHLPAGAARRYQSLFQKLSEARDEPVSGASPRGWVDLQISNPTVTIPPGSVSTVQVHAIVRGHYRRDSGAGAFPDPLHGEVQALYTLHTQTLADGRRVLRVQPSANDADLQFIPVSGAGLSAADLSTVVTLVRQALRHDFTPTDVELPSDFAFGQFGVIGGGPFDALVLPVQLSGAALPAGAVSSVTNRFIGSDEFAIAVSKESVQQQLDQLTDAIKKQAEQFEASYAGATYTASVAPMTMDWKAGSIDISGSVHLHTDAWYAPDGDINFTQTITLALDVSTQTVSVKAVGDPAVNESWWIPHGSAVSAVRSARDNAIASAGGLVSARFADARTKLLAGLLSFDRYASVAYKAVEVTVDGIIVRGAIGAGGRIDAFVQFAEIPEENAFNALWSWIPGGRIDRFVWSWVEHTHLISWFDTVSTFADSHRFVCPKPPGLVLASRICLRIEGTRLNEDGFTEEVVAGEICSNGSHEPILSVPAGFEKLLIPLWGPDPPYDRALGEQVTGYVNLAGNRVPGSVTTNVLVYFTGPEIQRPLELISRALSGTRQRDMSLLVIIVLPRGTFDRTRRDVEAMLGHAGERFPAHVEVTEDYLEGWSRTFDAAGASAFLLNARGGLVWRRNGPLDPAGTARALDEYLVVAPAPRMPPLALAVQQGRRVADVTFTDLDGRQYALRRFRGRRVLLTFWNSWSEASLAELRRLEALRRQPGAPMIFAINGGEPRSVIDEVRRRENLSFPIVDDAGEALGSYYGVRCWPTSVWIGEAGIVTRIQCGLSHEHGRPAGQATPPGA